MTSQPLTKLSDIRAQLAQFEGVTATLQEYNWHLSALRKVQTFDPKKNLMSITIDGRSLIEGAFDEPRLVGGLFDELEQLVVKALERYLLVAIEEIKKEFRDDHDVDPDT